MNRGDATNLFTKLIDQQTAEGQSESTPCLMLTGKWYSGFPEAPVPVASLGGGRAIYLLTLDQGRAIRDLLADSNYALDTVEIEVCPKANPKAVNDRHRSWERDRIRALVRRNPGNQAGRYLREGRK